MLIHVIYPVTMLLCLNSPNCENIIPLMNSGIIDKKERNDLTSGNVWKKLIGFFIPIMIGMLFQQLYNTVDAIIVGRFVGTEALAAVAGSPAVIINLVLGFFNGLASGATIIISQCFGAGNEEGVSKAVHTVTAFCLIAGIVLTFVCRALTPWALKAIGNPEDIRELSESYMKIFFAGTVPMMLFNAGSGILRAVGDSATPLKYLVLCTVLNIILDIVFVIYFSAGVAGAAWATAVSIAVSAVLIMRDLAVKPGPQKLYIRKIGIDRRTLSRTMYIGVPSGIQSAMYSISNLILQASVNSFGSDTVAAWAVTGKLDGIFWVLSNSFGTAICAFTGQCFGAGLTDRMKKGTKAALIMDVAVAVIFASILLPIAPFALRLFTEDQGVIDEAVHIMLWFVPFYFIWCFIEVYSNTLRGAGDSIRPAVIVLLGICLLRILWVAFVVPVWHSIDAVSASYPVSWAVTALALLIYYLRSDWLRRCSKQLNV